MTVEQGQPFPAFTGPSHDGQTVSLADYRAGESLVVFFYPAANTGG